MSGRVLKLCRYHGRKEISCVRIENTRGGRRFVAQEAVHEIQFILDIFYKSHLQGAKLDSEATEVSPA